MRRLFLLFVLMLSALFCFCAPWNAGRFGEIGHAAGSSAENAAGYMEEGQTPEEDAPEITLIVNGRPLDASALPLPAEEKNGVWLVPLRLVAEALGYTVAWDGLLGDAVVEGPIQTARFHPGEYIAQFTGKLHNIGLSGPEEMAAAPFLLDGSLYVPVTVFVRFFNEVEYGPASIEIRAQAEEITE